jgi:hypothetical protein
MRDDDEGEQEAQRSLALIIALDIETVVCGLAIVVRI